MLSEGPDTVLMNEGEMWCTGTSLVRKRFTLESYTFSGSMPRTLRNSWGEGRCLMSEVPV